MAHAHRPASGTHIHLYYFNIFYHFFATFINEHLLGRQEREAGNVNKSTLRLVTYNVWFGEHARTIR